MDSVMLQPLHMLLWSTYILLQTPYSLWHQKLGCHHYINRPCLLLAKLITHVLSALETVIDVHSGQYFIDSMVAQYCLRCQKSRDYHARRMYCWNEVCTIMITTESGGVIDCKQFSTLQKLLRVIVCAQKFMQHFKAIIKKSILS